jgi:hypothetical protein
MPLPHALEFLQFGWWVIHVVAIYLVYSYAYRKGRRDERRAPRSDTRPPAPAPRREDPPSGPEPRP